MVLLACVLAVSRCFGSDEDEGVTQRPWLGSLPVVIGARGQGRRDEGDLVFGLAACLLGITCVVLGTIHGLRAYQDRGPRRTTQTQSPKLNGYVRNNMYQARDNILCVL
jgi:hypothetical protein